MGLFFAEDPHFNENERQTGFLRYRQVLSVRFGQWWKIDLLTLAGFVPLAAGIFYAIASTSLLVLLPCSILGGMISGPFLAGMYDAILCGLRDEPRPWWDRYKRSWRQNWRGSLIPGALLGLMLGLYAFMGMLFWVSEVPPSLGTVALYLFAMLLYERAGDLGGAGAGPPAGRQYHLLLLPEIHASYGEGGQKLKIAKELSMKYVTRSLSAAIKLFSICAACARVACSWGPSRPLP